MSARIFLSGVALVVMALTQSDANAASAKALIEQAETHVTDGSVSAERDLAPLIAQLNVARDESELGELIEAIADLGQFDGASPAAVKAYLRQNAPPALITVVGGRSGWSVRGDALMALRSLNASDAFFDQAIAVANADTSKEADFIRSRGELLASWKEQRDPVVETAVAAAAVAPNAKEQAALTFLRSRNQRVSNDDLGQAAMRGDTAVVSALLDAGMDANAKLDGGTPLEYAAALGCNADKAPVEDRLAAIEVLLKRGAKIDQLDERGNTVLMRAVQGCPLPVIEKLVSSGAKVDIVNAQTFTPLQMAFVMSKWDVADYLVTHGARLSKQQGDMVFATKPTDPKQLAIVTRALGK